MKKDTKITTKEIQKNPVAIKDSDVLPAELMQQLEEKLPDWIKELEADGTSVLRWNFEYTMLLEYLLQSELGISEDEIDRLNTKIKEALPAIAKYKIEIPRLLAREDFAIISEMITRNKQIFKAQRANILLPDKQTIKKLK